MRLALDIRDEGTAGNGDTFVYDLERETLQRLTFDPGRNRGAIWSHDSQRIAFSRQLGDSEEIYWQAADGSGVAEALTLGSGMPMHPVEITSDGTTLLYTTSNLPRNIFAIPSLVRQAWESRCSTTLMRVKAARPYRPTAAGSPTRPTKVAATRSTCGRSPTGRYRALAGFDRRAVFHPQWSPDGRELFYLAVRTAGVAVMAVAIDSGEVFRHRAPAELFQGRYYYAAEVAAPDVYDVAADGQRFL